MLYTLAGPEIAVATTKAYSAQLAAMYALAVELAFVKGKIGKNDYKYYIEEVAVFDDQGHELPMDDFIVTYSGNDVATNDPQNPILVTNKYIWYKLPATGGVGVDLIYVVGILLTITGLTGGIALKKRERRSG